MCATLRRHGQETSSPRPTINARELRMQIESFSALSESFSEDGPAGTSNELERFLGRPAEWLVLSIPELWLGSSHDVHSERKDFRRPLHEMRQILRSGCSTIQRLVKKSFGIGTTWQGFSSRLIADPSEAGSSTQLDSSPWPLRALPTG